MKAEIERALVCLESEQECRIVLAVESGSRAWGFASPDSDYDVRFIYARSATWYLDLQEQRDTIEAMLPKDLDCAGWDLRKALQLFAGCNLSLNEWIGSPIVYRANPEFHGALRALTSHYFKPRKGVYHYLNMARRIHEDHMHGQEVNIKKAFYILRPILAARWILELGTMPPTEFSELQNAGLLPEEFAPEVEQLTREKLLASEGDRTTLSVELAQWIETVLSNIEVQAATTPTGNPVDWKPLNELFRTLVS